VTLAALFHHEPEPNSEFGFQSLYVRTLSVKPVETYNKYTELEAVSVTDTPSYKKS